MRLEIINAGDLFGIFSAESPFYESPSLLDDFDGDDVNLLGSSYDTGIVSLVEPLESVQLKFDVNSHGKYAAFLRFETVEGANLGYMSRKLEWRLGDSWIKASRDLRDPRGYCVDSNGEPLVVLSSRGVHKPSYFVAMGCLGATQRTLGEMGKFLSEVGFLSNVGNAFVDSCCASSDFRSVRRPKNIYLNCAFTPD